MKNELSKIPRPDDVASALAFIALMDVFHTKIGMEEILPVIQSRPFDEGAIITAAQEIYDAALDLKTVSEIN
jgi:hypothetical protein